VAVVALLALTAGCSTILGPGEPNQEKLQEPKAYDWDTDADATYRVARSNYTAVFSLEHDNLTVYERDGLGTEHPLTLTGLKYRFENGTVVDANHTELNVTQTRKRATINVPEAGGQVAFTTARHGKRFRSQTFIDGTHEVVLPPNARVGLPLLSQVHPNGYQTDRVSDRVVVTWNEAVQTRSILVRYYLQLDLVLFGSLAALLVVVGAVGVVYYLRQIRELEAQREEVGLDVDTGDDEFGDGPPPGMR
jgi:hypothetical protein